jgi:hypothetical protein
VVSVRSVQYPKVESYTCQVDVTNAEYTMEGNTDKMCKPYEQCSF